MKNFAAIDFETANECRSRVCSVDVVVVREVHNAYGMEYPEYKSHDTLQASHSIFGNTLPNH